MSTPGLNLTISGKVASAVAVSALQRSDAAPIAGLSLPINMSAVGNVWSAAFTDGNRAPFYLWSATITFADGTTSPLLSFNTAGGIVPANLLQINGTAANPTGPESAGVGMQLKPAGGLYTRNFVVPGSDSLPLVVGYRNGSTTPDGSIVFTVSLVSGNQYVVSATIPSNYIPQDALATFATGTSGGVPYSIPLDAVEIVLPLSTASINASVTVQPTATGSVPQNQPAFQNVAVTAAADYAWVQPFTISNFDGTLWTQIVWTAKRVASDPDSAALLTVKLSNPGRSDDGLILFSGAAPVSPMLASDGTITGVVLANVSGVPSLTFTVNLSARATALTPGSYFWEPTVYLAGAKSQWLGTGRFIVRQALRTNPVAS